MKKYRITNFPHIPITESKTNKSIITFVDFEERSDRKELSNLFQLNTSLYGWTPIKPIDRILLTDISVKK